MVEVKPTTWNEALDIVIQQFKDIMLQRHLKYGTGNINAFGEVGCIVRITDKIERLKQWYNSPNETVFDDETLEDTWIDAGNYAIIRMLYAKGWWDLPVEKEKEKLNVYTEALDKEHIDNCQDITCLGCEDLTKYCCNGRCGNGKEEVVWDAAHPLILKKSAVACFTHKVLNCVVCKQ